MAVDLFCSYLELAISLISGFCVLVGMAMGVADKMELLLVASLLALVAVDLLFRSLSAAADDEELVMGGVVPTSSIGMRLSGFYSIGWFITVYWVKVNNIYLIVTLF